MINMADIQERFIHSKNNSAPVGLVKTIQLYRESLPKAVSGIVNNTVCRELSILLGAYKILSAFYYSLTI
jgi:hypothetical protein